MASIQPIELGIEMTDPNWPILCMAISVHATRALALLESGEVEKAVFSLKRVAGIVEMATSICNMPIDIPLHGNPESQNQR